MIILEYKKYSFRWGHQPKEMLAASLPPTCVMKCTGTRRTAAQVRRLVVNYQYCYFCDVLLIFVAF